MNKRINLLMCAVVAAPLFLVGVAAAQQATSDRPVSTTATQQAKPPLTAQQKAELKLLVDKRKADMKIKLSTAEKKRLQSRCKNSQGSLSSLQGRIAGIKTSREQVYDNLTTRLTTLSEKLKSHDIDTATLDSQVIALQERIVTFKADLTAYELAIGDTATMDCASDPEAFKASLETTRAAREKVNIDGNGIRTYVNDTIKVTLKQLREQLAATNAKTEGEE